MFPHPLKLTQSRCRKFAENFGEFFFVMKPEKLAEPFGYYCYSNNRTDRQTGQEKKLPKAIPRPSTFCCGFSLWHNRFWKPVFWPLCGGIPSSKSGVKLSTAVTLLMPVFWLWHKLYYSAKNIRKSRCSATTFSFKSVTSPLAKGILAKERILDWILGKPR